MIKTAFGDRSDIAQIWEAIRTSHRHRAGEAQLLREVDREITEDISTLPLPYGEKGVMGIEDVLEHAYAHSEFYPALQA